MRFCTLFGYAVLAIPFYFLWNYFAPIYLATLPSLYLSVPFWHCVGIFVLLGIIRLVIFPSRGFHFAGFHHYGYGRCRKW